METSGASSNISQPPLARRAYVSVCLSLSAGIYSFSTQESTETGTPIGRIKAVDADIGINAEMDYSITGGDGQDMFDVTTDRVTQEGVLTVKKVNFPWGF